jgi:hypothetical protein
MQAKCPIGGLGNLADERSQRQPDEYSRCFDPTWVVRRQPVDEEMRVSCAGGIIGECIRSRGSTASAVSAVDGRSSGS